MPKKTEDPIITAAIEASDAALKRRRRGVFDDPWGALRAVVNVAAKTGAREATKGTVKLDVVEEYLRERNGLLDREEVDGIMRGLYSWAGRDDELPEHLRLPDSE